jgi:uncharacterized protein YfdQ (DUF2303 family)
MANKAATEELVEGEPLLQPLAVDLGIIAKLGTKADGIEIVSVKKPAGMVGLPDEIPVALRRGNNPAVESVAHLLDFYRTIPERKVGQATAQTFESFCELVNRHKTEHSAIFADADWKKPSFTAVIDYHQSVNGGNADNGKHRVHYAFPLSEEWKVWNKFDGQKMSQEEFAYFLEDRVAELSSPTDEERIRYERDFATTVATPAKLIELSRGLQVNIASKVKTAHTLASGEGQIVWEESHQDASGQPVKVPGMFVLSIAPFFMGEKMRIPVRLRYRPAAGSITWMYQLYRPDQFVTEHVRATLFEAKDRTSLPAFEGAPEMSL